MAINQQVAGSQTGAKVARKKGPLCRVLGINDPKEPMAHAAAQASLDLDTLALALKCDERPAAPGWIEKACSIAERLHAASDAETIVLRETVAHAVNEIRALSDELGTHEEHYCLGYTAQNIVDRLEVATELEDRLEGDGFFSLNEHTIDGLEKTLQALRGSRARVEETLYSRAVEEGRNANEFDALKDAIGFDAITNVLLEAKAYAQALREEFEWDDGEGTEDAAPSSEVTNKKPTKTTSDITDDSTVAVHLVHASDTLGELIAIESQHDEHGRLELLTVALRQLWMARWDLGLVGGAGLLSNERGAA
jgi:hypothetical protein